MCSFARPSFSAFTVFSKTDNFRSFCFYTWYRSWIVASSRSSQ